MPMQIRRNLTVGGPAPTAGDAVEGQLVYHQPAAANGNLYVRDTSTIRQLIHPDRQVELAGAQTITGAKTIALSNLIIPGGGANNILTTDGAGVLSWSAAPSGGLLAVTIVPPGTSPSGQIRGALVGDGTSPVANHLGLTVASAAQVTAGTDDVNPVTSLRLRDITGALSALDTTADTNLVAAINEIYGEVGALQQAISFQGTWNPNTNAVVAAVGSSIGATLPAAAGAGPNDNRGWLVIASAAGPLTGNAGTGTAALGDFLISNGSSWTLLPLGLPASAAINVAVSTITAHPTFTATNVQDAIETILDLIAAAGIPEPGTDGAFLRQRAAGPAYSWQPGLLASGGTIANLTVTGGLTLNNGVTLNAAAVTAFSTALADSIPVLSDATLSGTGVTGSPLSVLSLATARTIGLSGNYAAGVGGTQITSTAASFDGTANVTISAISVSIDDGIY